MREYEFKVGDRVLVTEGVGVGRRGFVRCSKYSTGGLYSEYVGVDLLVEGEGLHNLGDRSDGLPSLPGPTGRWYPKNHLKLTPIVGDYVYCKSGPMRGSTFKVEETRFEQLIDSTEYYLRCEGSDNFYLASHFREIRGLI